MEDTTTMLVFLLLPALTILCTLLLRAAISKEHATSCSSDAVDVPVPPPSPWRLPLVGNLHQLAGRRLLPHRSLASLAAAHGPVMLLRLGQVRAVVVSSAAAAREVMQTHDRVFASRPSLAVPGKLFYGCTDIAFAPHGPYWVHARKMSVLHLLSPARVRAYRAVREEEVQALVQMVHVQRLSCGGGVVRLSELLAGFAKDVTGRIVFGASPSTAEGWGAKVDTLLEEGNALLGTFHVQDCFPGLAWLGLGGLDNKVRKAFERIDPILEEILEVAGRQLLSPQQDTPTTTSGSTFVHVMLSLDNISGGSAAWRFSRDNVKAILMDLFGAGTEATIVVLEWVMAELVRNKGAMERLQHELRKSLISDSDMITEHDLQGMVYLKAVIKETIRLHPPGPLLLPHEAMESTRIQQYHIPRKTMVIINAWAIGRDPHTWESPMEFRPERFIGSEVSFRGRHFQLIPFGSGRRMCPGINFTMSILEIAIANLVGRFNWALREGETELDMEETPGVASRKRVPLCVIARPWP
ncbi:cytochrome P450 71A4 [Aegilops tauschii subsp. strangulata]|nr:cytochrome P450 71A1 [Aegilops tauschii subsp. strangulata]